MNEEIQDLLLMWPGHAERLLKDFSYELQPHPVLLSITSHA
jgi:hypothetical protein